MYIALLIGHSVVSAVMSNPPKRSSLSGTRSEPRSGELNNSPCFEGVMAELSMIKARDASVSKDPMNLNSFLRVRGTKTRERDETQVLWKVYPSLEEIRLIINIIIQLEINSDSIINIKGGTRTLWILLCFLIDPSQRAPLWSRSRTICLISSLVM